MKVAFRVDASLAIGSGHVMRCLTLADALQAQGSSSRFICREHAGHLCRLIEARGHEVVQLPVEQRCRSENESNVAHADWLGATQEADASATLEALADAAPWDWLVVDHYALEASWEKQFRRLVQRIFVIDDLADREHDCDLLLDQSAAVGNKDRYARYVPSRARVLLGLDYALLRPEFSELRSRRRQRDGRLNRLLVFFGGSDPSDETGKALQAIKRLDRNDLDVDVILGAGNPQRKKLLRFCETLPNVEVHIQVENMAERMTAADLALGAAGGATWERCCMGLPSVLVTIADNQKAGLASLLNKRAALYLGEAKAVTVTQMERVLQRLSCKPGLLRRLSERSAALVDGQGVSRVLARMAAA